MSDSSPVAFVGLGNPGTQYQKTRHNVGFLFLDYLSELWNVQFSLRKKWNAQIAISRSVSLVKPQAFMNLSGEVVSPLSRYFGWNPKRILVIYDDADIEFGDFRFSLSGSSAGHKGIGSILENFQTLEIPRLRIGIGRNPDVSLEEHVLHSFSLNEYSFLDSIFSSVAEATEFSLNEGLEMATNRFSRSLRK